ncbi:MAG: hypothetical protein J1F32_06480 [Erysipelotrichales bacterium]|nr:hypothetical protein [Erysipelotrichales bacterium]
MDKITYILISELFKLKTLLENESNADNNKVSNAIKELTDVAKLLYDGNNNAIDRLHYLFVQGNDISNIAQSNEWVGEFESIKEKISYLIGIVRTEQKRDPTNFNNVKNYNNGTYASMPGHLAVSQYKLDIIQEEYKLNIFKKLRVQLALRSIEYQLSYGDTQPAVVVSINPFIVAAYSDEMDAVVLLKFPIALAKRNNIKLHDRLVSINCYMRSGMISKDIFAGENYLGNWTNFRPLIGDLLSYNMGKIEQHKKNIPEFLWIYVQTLGEEYLRDHKDLVRNGFWFINKKI